MNAPIALDERSPTQRRLLEALLQHAAGLSVDNLTLEVKVTANAVRQHLTVLERDGLVIHEAVRAARGRPQFIYQLSPRGREVFPRRYRELAAAALCELGETLGNAELKRAMRRMGDRAARATGSANSSVATTAQIMKQMGYEAELGAKDRDEIVARNCVFHRLAEQFSAVCEFDLGFMESATGRKVVHRECMVRGGKVCRFKFTGTSKTGATRRK